MMKLYGRDVFGGCPIAEVICGEHLAYELSRWRADAERFALAYIEVWDDAGLILRWKWM